MNPRYVVWLGAAAVAVLSLSALLAGAQEPGPAPRPPGEFGEYPDGPPPAPQLFKSVDANKDGSVSEEEFTAFIERRRENRGPRWEDGPPPPPGGFDRRDGRRGPPPGGGPEHQFGERPQGPPPGGFERGERGERGFEPGPPPDPRYRPGPPGEFRDGGPDGPRGPRPPQGPPPVPPRFEEIDANGDGNITKPEFEAFHESHHPPRPE